MKWVDLAGFPCILMCPRKEEEEEGGRKKKRKERNPRAIQKKGKKADSLAKGPAQVSIQLPPPSANNRKGLRADELPYAFYTVGTTDSRGQLLPPWPVLDTLLCLQDSSTPEPSDLRLPASP